MIKFYAFFLFRNAILVSSSLSAECWIISLTFDANHVLKEAYVEEPNDEKLLSIIDDGKIVFIDIVEKLILFYSFIRFLGLENFRI